MGKHQGQGWGNCDGPLGEVLERERGVHESSDDFLQTPHHDESAVLLRTANTELRESLQRNPGAELEAEEMLRALGGAHRQPAPTGVESWDCGETAAALLQRRSAAAPAHLQSSRESSGHS